MPTIEFRMDTTGIPHTYIAVNNGAGVTQMYGFAPAVPGQLWGRGHIYDEATSGPLGKEHEYDHTTGPIEVTTEQYNRAINEITNAINNPPYYNLPNSFLWPSAVNQCATWANHIAEVGGFADKLPWGGNGWNPYGQSVWNVIDRFWKRNPDATGAEGDPFTGLPWPGQEDILYQIKRKTGSAATIPSPIILDLDGNGVQTTAVKSGSYFDHAADGFAEQTGWVGQGDGLLVRDLSGNGRIDSGRELFGSETLLRNGKKAANGFEALAELDSNGDGKIDSTDTAYASLRVWKDADGNGFSGAGELLTLAEAGVQSIGVGFTGSTLTDSQGNQHRQVGSYTSTAGQTRNATDVWFSTDTTYSVATDRIDVTADIAALPNARGYGLVRDLHQAMARDGSGVLKGLVSQFTDPAMASATDSVRYGLAQSIITDQARGLPQMNGAGIVRDIRTAASNELWWAVA
jgi:hypothetical protein